MKKLIPSRGPLFDREIAVKKMGSGMYDMILAMSARAREIRRQNKDTLDYDLRHPCVTALLELQHGKIDGQEYFKKVK
jgi:DNA-directed RNA polymerase subunit K/omega